MKALLLPCALFCAHAATPDVHEIMRRVALNQDRAQDSRRQFVFRQKEDVRLHRSNGKLAREEHREYLVTPEAHGFHKDLVEFHGRYEKDKRYVSADQPTRGFVNVGIDAGLVEGLSEGLTGDRDSRDGFAHYLFPLTASEQLKYRFRLVGQEAYRGRAVFRVAFEPLKDADWKGEALIDAEEYQPVFISTSLAQRVPLVVRTVFGTNVRGLGFSVSYQRFDDGLWFPVSYGGEFELRAVFFYKRNISISMTNSDFRRADVNSKVTYAAGEP